MRTSSASSRLHAGFILFFSPTSLVFVSIIAKRRRSSFQIEWLLVHYTCSQITSASAFENLLSRSNWVPRTLLIPTTWPCYLDLHLLVSHRSILRLRPVEKHASFRTVQHRRLDSYRRPLYCCSDPFAISNLPNSLISDGFALRVAILASRVSGGNPIVEGTTQLRRRRRHPQKPYAFLAEPQYQWLRRENTRRYQAVRAFVISK